MEEKNTPFTIFNKFPNLLVAISLRKDGGMKIDENSNQNNQTLINRKNFLSKINLLPKDIVSAKLEHGSNVKIVSKKNCGSFIPFTDGLITKEKKVFLSITVADCLPVVLYHPKTNTIALIHAGWKGLNQNIIQKAIKELIKVFNINPQELIAGIGPGIEECHYEIKKVLVKKFNSYKKAISEKNNSFFLNLKFIAQKQLIKAGIKKENIQISPVCTYCEAENYFSFRKDKTNPTKAMIVVAGIK